MHWKVAEAAAAEAKEEHEAAYNKKKANAIERKIVNFYYSDHSRGNLYSRVLAEH